MADFMRDAVMFRHVQAGWPAGHVHANLHASVIVCTCITSVNSKTWRVLIHTVNYSYTHIKTAHAHRYICMHACHGNIWATSHLQAISSQKLFSPHSMDSILAG